MIKNIIGEIENSTGRKVFKRSFRFLGCLIFFLVVFGPLYAKEQPAAPKGVAVVNDGDRRLTVTWEKQEEAKGYQLQYSRTMTFDTKKTVKLGPEQTSCVLEDLKAGGTYYIRVRSFEKQQGKKVYSAWSRTRRRTVRFFAPSIDHVKNLRDRSLHAAWSRVPGADGYQIQYARSAAYTRRRTVDLGKRTSFTIKDLKKEQGYFVRVRAYRLTETGRICTEWTEHKETRIVFYPPRILALKNNEPRTARLTIGKIPGAEGYQIQYSKSRDFSSRKNLLLEGQQTSASVTGLKKYETYYFRVRGFRTVSGKKACTAWSAAKKININYSAKKIRLDVPSRIQYPELPVGCEPMALTNLLTYFGFSLDKCEIADHYLPTSSWDFVTSFLGNPHKYPGGRACCAPAIVITANSYLESHGSRMRAHEVSGGTFADFYDYVENGYPVLIWTSIRQESVARVTSEVRYYGGRAYWLTFNSHTVVLCGYDREAGTVDLADSISGPLTMSASWIEQIYKDRGSQAVVIY